MTDSDESDEENNEHGASKPDVSAKGLLQDPILAVASVLERALQQIDDLHARFELLPGRVQFSSAVLIFLSSIYLGPVIKTELNSAISTAITPVLADLVAFPLGVQVILFVLALVVFQVAVANEKLTEIDELVETEMSDNEVVSDGGWQTRRVKTSTGGAFSGAALGTIFGGLFGYISTIFGGMIFGAIVGNLIEEWSVRRKNRHRVQSRIVSYLLRERIFDPETVEVETIQHWFPADDASLVTDALTELLGERESPVVRASNEEIQLTDAAEAVTYLDRNGGRVPPEFEGPNRPH